MCLWLTSVANTRSWHVNGTVQTTGRITTIYKQCPIDISNWDSRHWLRHSQGHPLSTTDIFLPPRCPGVESFCLNSNKVTELTDSVVLCQFEWGEHDNGHDGDECVFIHVTRVLNNRQGCLPWTLDDYSTHYAHLNSYSRMAVIVNAAKQILQLYIVYICWCSKLYVMDCRQRF